MKLLPLSVLTNAAGLMCEPRLVHLCRLCAPTASHCVYLNKLCSSAGLDFTFDASTNLLVNLADVCTVTIPTPFTRDLPSHDPFSHARYIDERALSAGSTTSSLSCSVQSWHTANSRATPGTPIASRSIDSHAAVRQTETNPLPPVQPPQVGVNIFFF